MRPVGLADLRVETPGSFAGTVQRVVLEPTVVLHTAAVTSLRLGIGSGVWLAVLLPS